MRALKEFRTKAYGLPDLLPWAALVDDGIVLTKNGGYLAGWNYTGPDLDSATGAELAAMATRINAALKLGDGWVLHCDAIRTPSQDRPPAGAFPDRTTRLIEDVRRAHLASDQAGYTSRYVLTVTWYPLPDTASRASLMFMEGGAATSATRNLLSFKERLGEIEGRLSSFLKIRRLQDSQDDHGVIDSELLNFLEFCVSFHDRPFRFSMVPMYLDAVLGRHDFTTGSQPFLPRHPGFSVATAGALSVVQPLHRARSRPCRETAQPLPLALEPEAQERHECAEGTDRRTSHPHQYRC